MDDDYRVEEVAELIIFNGAVGEDSLDFIIEAGLIVDMETVQYGDFLRVPTSAETHTFTIAGITANSLVVDVQEDDIVLIIAVSNEELLSSTIRNGELTPQNGASMLRFFHASKAAETVPTDLTFDGGNGFFGFQTFAQPSPYQSLFAGQEYMTSLIGDGMAGSLLDTTFMFDFGNVVTVIAFGEPGNTEFPLNLTTIVDYINDENQLPIAGTSRVKFLHASAEPLAAESVQIIRSSVTYFPVVEGLDRNEVTSQDEFSDATDQFGYASVPSSNFTFSVSVNNINDLLPTRLNLVADTFYTVIVAGTLADDNIGIFADQDDVSGLIAPPADFRSHVRFVHAVPDVGGVTLTVGGISFTGSFGQSTGYTPVEVGEEVEVSLAGITTNTAFIDGVAYSIYAVNTVCEIFSLFQTCTLSH